MSDGSINNELQKYWSILTDDEQRVIRNVINSFIKDSKGMQVDEEGAVYQVAGSKLQEESLRLLTDAQKESVLELIKTVITNEAKNYGPVTIEQYNREIDEAVREIEAGEFITQEDVEKEMEQW